LFSHVGVYLANMTFSIVGTKSVTACKQFVGGHPNFQQRMLIDIEQ